MLIIKFLIDLQFNEFPIKQELNTVGYFVDILKNIMKVWFVMNKK